MTSTTSTMLTQPRKGRILYVADATVHTGFARVTHNLVPLLRNHWDISVLGIGYNGDPHEYEYPIYPASASEEGDIWGFGRIASLAEALGVEAIIINNDPWVVERYLVPLQRLSVPVIAYMPVDSPNLKPGMIKRLSDALAHAVWYTRFGQDEAQRMGYTGASSVIPHGVDPLYTPLDRAYARRLVRWEQQGIPTDAFIVGNVNRNSLRKRLDLTLYYFAQWVRQHNIPDHVYLYLHCSKQDSGWDLPQLARFFGISKRTIMIDNLPGLGMDEALLPAMYSSLDLQISTTLGEGFGLTTLEGMACGVPQIVPRWSALGEWAEGAVRYVPVTSIFVHPNRLNTVGGVASEPQFIEALQELYSDAGIREHYRRLGRERAKEPRFRWSTIADQFDVIITDVVQRYRAAAAPLAPAEAVEALT